MIDLKYYIDFGVQMQELGKKCCKFIHNFRLYYYLYSTCTLQFTFKI